MDEMEILLADARSIISEMSMQVELAANTDAEDEVKEAIHAAIRYGVEARDRLEEAMDYSESGDYQLAIDESLRYIEDATDSAQLALGGERQQLLDETRFKIEQSVAAISRTADIESE